MPLSRLHTGQYGAEGVSWGHKRELKCRPCGMTEGPEVEEGSGSLQSGNWQELGATVKLTTPVPE